MSLGSKDITWRVCKMKKSKREKLIKAGYRFSDAGSFLGLSEAEAALVELKVNLTLRLKELRQKKNISQVELAKLLGSSQSRVAKIESASADVTLDLIYKALFILGDIPKVLRR
ncbi:MAG: helix-turn-helix transcriptional regulator [Proteobacteria bacterium]|nr:helix-turn-helix transcriptional regulator [Pseudomonadota bacterium]